ncbi:probable methyltransferase PMT9 [Tanacetum coccineum]|uniref:Methyltransferase n=1 Tax=Tanacetum coccineum TaxID=301880 RepID=A0ABQ5E5T2_9ASTR
MKQRFIKLYRSALKCETVMCLGKPLLCDKLMTVTSEASSGGFTGNWLFNNKEHGKASADASLINSHHNEFLLVVILLLRHHETHVPGGSTMLILAGKMSNTSIRQLVAKDLNVIFHAAETVDMLESWVQELFSKNKANYEPKVEVKPELPNLECMKKFSGQKILHQNNIQFALERGIPSALGVLGAKRLPYPRGYFVYSSPEAYAHDAENRRIWNAMHDLLGRVVVWAKSLSNSCYRKRAPGTNARKGQSSYDKLIEAYHLENGQRSLWVGTYVAIFLTKSHMNHDPNLRFYGLPAGATQTVQQEESLRQSLLGLDAVDGLDGTERGYQRLTLDVLESWVQELFSKIKANYEPKVEVKTELPNLECMEIFSGQKILHQNNIQFALERGIPSALKVLGTKRLPYPNCLDQEEPMLEKDKGEDDVASAQNATPTDVYISTPTIF